MISNVKRLTNSKAIQSEIILENDTHSALEYTTFAPTQILRSCREQRPSSKVGLDSSATGEVESLLHGGDVILFNFALKYVIFSLHLK